MEEEANLLKYQLAARDRQVIELTERVKKLDISSTIRRSILNCVKSWDLREEFSDLEDSDNIDGLQAIMDKFVVLGVRKLSLGEVDSALKIFNFLFKYSFSAVPTRIEQLSGSVDRANVDLQAKIDRLQSLRKEQKVVDVEEVD